MAAPAYLSELELAARRKGAQRRHSVSTYVKSIVRRADELTETDLDALRALTDAPGKLPAAPEGA